MKLQASAFNAHLRHMGQAVAWKKSYRCPCRDQHSGAASPTCTVCGGLGTFWDGPVDGWVGMSGQKVQRQWAEFGMWERGDVVVTIGSDTPVYAIGEFDRVEMSDSSSPFTAILTHTGSEKIGFQVVSIERCFWLGNGVAVDGGIPSVATDGALSWSANPPPDGTQYSLVGRRRPTYFVWGEFPQDRAHHGGEALPRRVVLRTFDLFGRG